MSDTHHGVSYADFEDPIARHTLNQMSAEEKRTRMEAMIIKDSISYGIKKDDLFRHVEDKYLTEEAKIWLEKKLKELIMNKLDIADVHATDLDEIRKEYYQAFKITLTDEERYSY